MLTIRDNESSLNVLKNKRIDPVPKEKAFYNFTGTRTVLPPRPPSDFRPKNKGREGIFWTTTFVDECKAIRLKHLLETATASNTTHRRDVWVLHTHFKTTGPNDPQLIRSKELIASIPGLKSAWHHHYSGTENNDGNSQDYDVIHYHNTYTVLSSPAASTDTSPASSIPTQELHPKTCTSKSFWSFVCLFTLFLKNHFTLKKIYFAFFSRFQCTCLKIILIVQ